MVRDWRMNLAHWGAFEVKSEPASDPTSGPAFDRLAIRPDPTDPEPSSLVGNIVSARHHRARVRWPMVRRGWWENGPGADGRRGADEYLRVGWDEILDRLAEELRRVTTTYGNRAIFGGSYGWASAGRFHHAQSQLHRFLNTIGGFTHSVNNYSKAASEVTVPHLVGPAGAAQVLDRRASWREIAAHTELIVAFGGIRRATMAVAPGGRVHHSTRTDLESVAASGTEVIAISPLADDTAAELNGRWISAVPGTDVALMLSMIWVLCAEDLADWTFLDRCCVGAGRVEKYVLGCIDGIPKTPEWAAELSGVPAAEIRSIARKIAGRRTLVMTNLALQRTQYGEQTVWAGLTLAAFAGQLGLPGGGYGHGYGSMGDIGSKVTGRLPTLDQGTNPVADSYIPCARVVDMLENPGAEFDFNGQRLIYPDTRLMYWVGGNPFHHHQDLVRLSKALSRPETIVVHEVFWTAMAKHADVVLPATMTIERDDIGAGRRDQRLVAMRKAAEPPGSARDDHTILADLATRLDVTDAFTEGRDVSAWLHHLYEQWRATHPRDQRPPEFSPFWSDGSTSIGSNEPPTPFAEFRHDPDARPLDTPSGRIELYSATVAEFNYPDCPGQAMWLPPREWLGAPLAKRFPLHLIANQPARRLHSQLDMGAHSQDGKIHGREPIRMHPDDAAARGISDRDIVRVFNDRGSCLAAATVTEDVRRSVVQLSTGAWYDPSRPDVATCIHGNPNVLTTDQGTSRLAQGCTGQHALVDIERHTGEIPPIAAYDVPPGSSW